MLDCVHVNILVLQKDACTHDKYGIVGWLLSLSGCFWAVLLSAALSHPFIMAYNVGVTLSSSSVSASHEGSLIAVTEDCFTLVGVS